MSWTRGNTGAAAELQVAADLLRKGRQVFRAVSPHASCDLLVLDEDGAFTRIEVRTVSARKDGTLCPVVKERDDCDLYAFVCGERIEYVLREDARRDFRQGRSVANWRRL